MQWPLPRGRVQVDNSCLAASKLRPSDPCHGVSTDVTHAHEKRVDQVLRETVLVAGSCRFRCKSGRTHLRKSWAGLNSDEPPTDHEVDNSSDMEMHSPVTHPQAFDAAVGDERHAADLALGACIQSVIPQSLLRWLLLTTR
jgi:hypothetical protein